MRSAIESGLSPDSGLDDLPRGGLHATHIELRRPLLNFSQPFGAECGPVFQLLVIPHRVNQPLREKASQAPPAQHEHVKKPLKMKNSCIQKPWITA